jgi:hypothetical protein
MPAGQSGFLDLGLGQSIGDWVDHGGPVEPQPVASHRPKLGEFGNEDGLRGHDPGGHAGATVA